MIWPLLGISFYYPTSYPVVSHFILIRNFEKVILAGYRWLSDNYIDGDKIFLFGKGILLTSRKISLTGSVIPGFSRGAYQVRVLAGMIDRVRLIWALLRISDFLFTNKGWTYLARK